MNIRFINARILSMKENEEIYLGELHVKGNRISYVGKALDTDEVFDRVIDCNGNLLMPGFKNAHTHSAMTFLRSYADDLSLHDWLFDKVFPAEEKLTANDIYELAKLAILEYLTSGITANFDMYMQPAMLAKAAIDTGFRTVILGCVNNFTESVQIMRENFEKLNKLSSRVTYRLGFHAEYTTDYSILVELSKLANELKEPVYTHSSETDSEVEGCKERHGKTPTELFDDLGLFNYGGGCYHCVAVNSHDLEIMEHRNVSIITCPGSNTKLASGIAPIVEMTKYNINLGIGTDGPASNNCLDMFREMFLVTGLQKLLLKDASAMDSLKVLSMATVGGAKAMKLDEADVLDVNKLADIIMIDLHMPNMQPLNNIAKNIVYSGSKQNVIMTMVDGNILYENGKFYINEDVEELYHRCQEITDRIKNEVKEG